VLGARERLDRKDGERLHLRPIVAGTLGTIGQLYDRIGTGYTDVRREDPRIAAAIWRALGDARTVVNVGAGAGSYEPRDREVVAVEPSALMIAQRPPGAARVVQASADALPFADGSFDAAMVVLSDHHWPDRAGGLRELRRVARRRAVVFSFDVAFTGTDWLTRDYLTAFRPGGLSIEEIGAHLGAQRIEPVPIPHDCRDGFLNAYWRRPHAYLDPRVRDGISVFRLLPPGDVEVAIARLRADLESGEWERRNAGILDLGEMDLGYRLFVADY
jgi:SAM-dependent methyltransferase